MNLRTKLSYNQRRLIVVILCFAVFFAFLNDFLGLDLLGAFGRRAFGLMLLVMGPIILALAPSGDEIRAENRKRSESR